MKRGHLKAYDDDDDDNACDATIQIFSCTSHSCRGRDVTSSELVIFSPVC